MVIDPKVWNAYKGYFVENQKGFSLSYMNWKLVWYFSEKKKKRIVNRIKSKQGSEFYAYHASISNIINNFDSVSAWQYHFIVVFQQQQQKKKQHEFGTKIEWIWLCISKYS